MDARYFEELAAALERERRQDYRFFLVFSLVVIGFYFYVMFGMQPDLAHDQERIAEALSAADGSAAAQILSAVRDTAFQTTMRWTLPWVLFALPFLFNRYRWRNDKALIELLRAQSKDQAS